MKSVTSHFSARTMDEFPSLLQYIFPDSQIAKQVQLHRTKLGYVVNHGLAPYYKEKNNKCYQRCISFCSMF